MERTIKMLEAQMLQWLKDELGDIKREVRSIDDKVGSLLEMRARLMGMAAVVSIVLTLVFQIVVSFLKSNSFGNFL